MGLEERHRVPRDGQPEAGAWIGTEGQRSPPGAPASNQPSAELGSELLAGSTTGTGGYRAGQGDGEWIWSGADEERRVGRMGASGRRWLPALDVCGVQEKSVLQPPASSAAFLLDLGKPPQPLKNKVAWSWPVAL